jgi:hypothetical protein
VSDSNEACRICGEKRLAHVGPGEMHPREARSEGVYKLVAAGTHGFGVWCSICRGPCDGHGWERYEFVPAGDPLDAIRRECGLPVMG